MLDEEEFARVSELYRDAIRGVQRHRQSANVELSAVPDLYARFEPVRREYERLTGMVESNHNAIMHHRISIYGPLCHACGKPLRTPQAKLCAACSARRPRSTDP